MNSQNENGHSYTVVLNQSKVVIDAALEPISKGVHQSHSEQPVPQTEPELLTDQDSSKSWQVIPHLEPGYLDEDAGADWLLALLIPVIIIGMCFRPLMGALQAQSPETPYNIIWTVVFALLFAITRGGLYILNRRRDSALDTTTVSYYSSYKQRAHGRYLPGTDHLMYGVHLQREEDRDFLELVCYQMKDDALSFRVVEREEIIEDVAVGVTQAWTLAQKAEELETQAWHEQQMSTNTSTDEALIQEMQRNRDIVRNQVAVAVQQTLKG